MTRATGSRARATARREAPGTMTAAPAAVAVVAALVLVLVLVPVLVLVLVLVLVDAAPGRKTLRSGLAGHGRATTRHRMTITTNTNTTTTTTTITTIITTIIASRAYSSACRKTATAIAIVVAGNAGNGFETETEIGSGGTIEIGTPGAKAAAAAAAAAETGPDYASAGLLVEPESTLRATPIRWCTSARAAAAAGGKRSRGAVIAGGRTTEAAGIVSMSLGRAETTTGARVREVRNTKGVIRIEHLAAVVYPLSPFQCLRPVELPLLRARSTTHSTLLVVSLALIYSRVVQQVRLTCPGISGI